MIIPYTKGHGLSQTEANYSKWIYGHLMNFAMKQTPVKDWEQPRVLYLHKLLLDQIH